MKLPFSSEQFFDVMVQYNQAVWPAQVVLTAAALAAVALLFVRRPWAAPALWSILAALWAWTGVAYHFAFFARINPAAMAFGLVFLAGAGAFVYGGVVRRSVTFDPQMNLRTLVGAALVVYALLVYPLWSAATGHPYPSLPTFGLPCPTTLFTVGLLCMAVGRGHGLILVAPLLWCLVGVQAAFLFGVIPGLGLGVAALVAAVLLVSDLRARAPTAAPA